MFLLLSKILDMFLAPLTWAMLFIVVGLVLRRRARLAVGLQVFGLLVLYVFSIEPVAAGLMRSVEAGVTPTYRPDVVYDAVIVLGGGLDPDATETSGRAEYNGAGDRILRGYELLREGKARNVLISGGSLDPRPEAIIEADVLSRQLQLWGIEPSRIFVEDKSRNTRENAVGSEKIIREQGWKTLLLVTSAAHMPRAYGCFAAVGVRPDTFVADVRAPLGKRPPSWLPRSYHLSASSDALRELAGRLVYRLRGWTVS
ncbi:YdcF family protein [Hyalangium rubrum]|uniref:YdcF family protein n=1 Tax=Hyalangium rubrum TaxID=3103134 RepID=A0ABU5HAB1_9BACT|nr:YdcF family protein [Hyalangium sp. s54d21]MDY7230418.1 YdcF family protein [Hyalangium sp. s54d21]